ncbi:hypothetical protein Nepgr_020278 [Nepenthes gracilis]|uniref:Uncharacterized protein n=1 Tax=Nepenthes gracilis TaxID=150966 RepID=A0AAD3SXU6_NEPGR|nr:hypothetical protein Nepgr_020278 [Nepenthes gracilis]
MPSLTSAAGPAALEVCEAESQPAGSPPARPIAETFADAVPEARDDVFILNDPEGPLQAAPVLSSEARGPVEPTVICVEPLSEFRAFESMAPSPEEGVALATDPVRASGRVAGTSSWQEPLSAPTAATLLASSPPAGEGEEPRREASLGDLAHSPSAAPSQVWVLQSGLPSLLHALGVLLTSLLMQAPGDANPFDELTALFHGGLQQVISCGRAWFASLEEENGRLQQRVAQLEALLVAVEDDNARLVRDMVGRLSPSESRLALEARY